MIAPAELIERFEPDLLQRYQDRLLPSRLQALAAMKRCRTRFAPRMLAQCMACGEQRSVPHSCGHRACPHCQHHDSEVWLQRQLAARVPATYFLITLTLPAELRGLAWSHQRVVYALLMQCAWETLNTFSHNDAKLGATAGAVGVLHTHNRRLDFHPHVHMVMPAAALDTQRKLWRTKCRRTRHPARPDRRALPVQPQGAGQGLPRQGARRHRARQTDAARQAAQHLGGRLPVRGRRQQGAAVPGPLPVPRRDPGDRHPALRGRLGHLPLPRRKTDKTAQRTLPGADFLWLVLQHVLPKGLRRSRNFGFLHPNSAGAIRLLQVLHLRAVPPAATSAAPPRPAWRCACGQPMRVLCRRMPALQPELPEPPELPNGDGQAPPPPSRVTSRATPCTTPRMTPNSPGPHRATPSH